jgi:hypothetical protein
MLRPTYDEIAGSFALWQEYIDPLGTTSEAGFNAMSHADRVAQIVETFGSRPEQIPTVEEVLADTSIGCGLHRWPVEGGSVQLNTEQLRPYLEEAYDAADPDWEAMVDLSDLDEPEQERADA